MTTNQTNQTKQGKRRRRRRPCRTGRCVRRFGHWWIWGLPCGLMGPYTTRAEADDDRRGVARTFQENPDLC